MFGSVNSWERDDMWWPQGHFVEVSTSLSVAAQCEVSASRSYVEEMTSVSLLTNPRLFKNDTKVQD